MNTGYECPINTGYECPINTGYECPINTGYETAIQGTFPAARKVPVKGTPPRAVWLQDNTYFRPERSGSVVEG